MKQPKFPGWRTMTSAQRYNAKMEALFEQARQPGGPLAPTQAENT